jgi:hypothetical protein
MVKSLWATDFGSCHVTLFPHLFSDVKNVKCNCSNFSISQKISKILNNFKVGQKKLLQLLQNYYKNYYMSKSVNPDAQKRKKRLVVTGFAFCIHMCAHACMCIIKPLLHLLQIDNNIIYIQRITGFQV